MPPMQNDESNDTILGLHSSMSRFTISIVVPNKPFKSVKANLTGQNEIAYLISQYKVALMAQLLHKQKGGSGDAAPITSAYTEKLKFPPSVKNMTPAEVLIKNPENRGELEKAINILQENLSKYPANQTVIDAIEDALYLLDSNQLQPKPVQATNSQFVLFDKRFKSMSGKKIRAALKVYVDFSYNNPWQVWIENADVKNPDAPIEKAEVENIRYASFSLTDEEMAGMIRAIEDNYMLFQTIHFRELWKASNEARWKPES